MDLALTCRIQIAIWWSWLRKGKISIKKSSDIPVKSAYPSPRFETGSLASKWLDIQWKWSFEIIVITPLASICQPVLYTQYWPSIFGIEHYTQTVLVQYEYSRSCLRWRYWCRLVPPKICCRLVDKQELFRVQSFSTRKIVWLLTQL